jgi:hypothetical protein
VMRALNGSADGLTVADSPIHGRGPWSMRTRRAGETLFVVHGRPVNLPFDYDYARGPPRLEKSPRSVILVADGVSDKFPRDRRTP